MVAVVRMTGPWLQTKARLSALANPALIIGAMDRAMGKEAHRLRGIMVKGFNTQGPPGVKWKPLSPMTLKIRKALGKRGTKALMRTGDLRKSINVVRENGAWFVGVHRTAKSGDGEKLVNIAEVHEFGTKKYTIRVTKKMRKFFLFLHIKSKAGHKGRVVASGPRRRGRGGRFVKSSRVRKFGKSVIMPLPKSKTIMVIHIPARPFIFPVWEQEQHESTRRIVADTLAALKVVS